MIEDLKIIAEKITKLDKLDTVVSKDDLIHSIDRVITELDEIHTSFKVFFGIAIILISLYIAWIIYRAFFKPWIINTFKHF